MFDRRWTPPPQHWGTALQGGLANIGSVLVDNDRERKRRERESLLDTREQDRYETGLLLTPGVRRTGGSAGSGAPVEPPTGGGPIAPGGESSTTSLPGISGALGGGSSRTALPGGFEFNPDHQREQDAADRSRKIAEVEQALIADGEDPQRAASRAPIIVDGIDTSYRGPSTEKGFYDQQERLTGIGEASQIRVGQAPRWTAPPPPPTPQLTTTVGPDGKPQYEWATPGEPLTGRPPNAAGRDPFARELPGFDAVFQQVSDDERYADLPFEERMEIARKAIAGEALPAVSDSTQTAGAAEPEGPSFLRRLGGAIHRSMNPVTALIPPPQGGGSAEIPPPPRNQPSLRPGPDTAAAPGAAAPPPAGSRPREVLDAAVQFYAPLPAAQREEAMREDGATGPEIQYMLSKIGR